MPDPRVFGAAPLDLVAKKRAPARGASFPTLHDERNDYGVAQVRLTPLIAIVRDAVGEKK